MEIKVKIGTPLCATLLICLGNTTHRQIDELLRKQDEHGNMILDVTFSVNGMEADFSRLLDFLTERYDKMILSEVQKVLHDKYADVAEKLDDVRQAIDNIDIDEFSQFRFDREAEPFS